MRKSKARQGIIDTAQKLIRKKGYTNIKVTEIAYMAKVSVGTLYYHFPKGKVDILAEIMSQKLEGFVEEFNRQLGVENVLERGMSLDDTLRWVFKKVIELRRPDRHFLSAIQSEMLASPDEYLEFVKRYQSTDGLRQAMGILSGIMLKSEAIDIAKLADKQETIQRLVGLLMSYQIVFPGYFGDDDGLIDLAVSVFLQILKS